MRKLILVPLVLLLAGGSLSAQGGRVVGFWLTADRDSQIEIYQVQGNKFNGRVVWLEEPLEDDGTVKRDKNNPDRSLRNRPTLGLEILKDFTFNASKNEWEKGTIYDPKNGRTYDAYMWLDGNNTLKLKGFVLGMRFLGRETEWTRERERRE
jgi:uncharacterized protein (DUF2147 family)